MELVTIRRDLLDSDRTSFSSSIMQFAIQAKSVQRRQAVWQYWHKTYYEIYELKLKTRDAGVIACPRRRSAAIVQLHCTNGADMTPLPCAVSSSLRKSWYSLFTNGRGSHQTNGGLGTGSEPSTLSS